MSDNIKIACFINGNKHILYKDILTLSSVKNFNPELDLFSCSDVYPLPHKYRYYLSSYNLRYFPISEDMRRFMDTYPDQGGYSQPVVLKYYLPIYLYNLGYDFAISLDYDMICLNKYNLQEILPYDDIMAASSIVPLREKLDNDQMLFLKKKLSIEDNVFNIKIPNLGFVVYNLKKYSQSQFLSRLIEVYRLVKELEVSHPCDEISYPIAMKCINHEIKMIPYKYNFCPLWANFSLEMTNIHYVGAAKPWKLFEMIKSGEIKKLPKICNLTHQMRASLIYQRYAAMLPFYDEIFNVSKEDYISQIVDSLKQRGVSSLE